MKTKATCIILKETKVTLVFIIHGKRFKNIIQVSKCTYIYTYSFTPKKMTKVPQLNSVISLC